MSFIATKRTYLNKLNGWIRSPKNLCGKINLVLTSLEEFMQARIQGPIKVVQLGRCLQWIHGLKTNRSIFTAFLSCVNNLLSTYSATSEGLVSFVPSMNLTTMLETGFTIEGVPFAIIRSV